MATAPTMQAEAKPTLTVFSGEGADPPLAPWPDFPAEDVIAGDPGGHRGVVLYRDPKRRYSVGVWNAHRPPSSSPTRAPNVATCWLAGRP